jgi:dTMP kinase
VLSGPQEPADRGGYATLLRNRGFLKFFVAQCVSSLGDWIGVLAIAVYASNLGGNAGVGAVMTARVLPGFLVGPVAGVLADRFDRKKLMITSDILRAAIIFSVPFVRNLGYLLFASVVLESLTLLWGPAKDASIPNFVERRDLQHANSLSLIAIYGPWPLASIVFAGIIPFADFVADNVPALAGLAENNQEALALWLDSLTFGFSALVIATLTIPATRGKRGKLDFGEAWRDLVEGFSFIKSHGQVRPWLLGIGVTFTAAGAVFSLGPGFVIDVLGAGKSGFGVLIGFLATGMIVGLLASGLAAKHISKDVLFSSCVLLLGASLIGLSSVGGLELAIPVAGALGFFGGIGYSTAYSLVQEHTSDELRGRTFSAAYTLIRVGTLLGLAVAPLFAEVVGDHEIGDYPITGTRITLWVAGFVVLGGGAMTLRAVKNGRKEDAVETVSRRSGFFVVFEGGEGAGKSTQMEAFVEWLTARGDEVVTTREPGGTAIGARIREILLDPKSGAMDPRTEALLYAADRAQHVAEVIRPALIAGKVVVSDRFVDSSLAYQGLARGLGIDEIYEISKWAIEGTLPDLVLFLKVDAATGLERKRTDPDRLELESDSFHDRVQEAYEALAGRFPERFAIIDAGRTSAEVHDEVVATFEQKVSEREQFGQLPRPGAPVAR